MVRIIELLRDGPRARAAIAEVKFDHQIVAIAKAVGADVVYSDDKGGLEEMATLIHAMRRDT